MNEPMTEMGRALRDDPRQHGEMCDPTQRRADWCPCGQTENIVAIEAEAARAVNERAERLVEAAVRALDWFVDGMNPCQWCGVYEEDDEGHESYCGVRALRAALRDTATPAPQGLDVERLAVAYHVAMHHGPHGRTNLDIAIAEEIARAYAGRDGE